MADLTDRNYDPTFNGLVTTSSITLVIGGVCLVGFETLRQLRRLPRLGFVFWPPWWWGRRLVGGHGEEEKDDARGEDVRRRKKPRKKMTAEDWEMGHLYHARVYNARNPAPPLPKWPLLWIWQSFWFTEDFYARTSGLDATVYVRFLRGCTWWVLLQMCTLAPVLLSIHLSYSTEPDKLDMTRASLSSIVESPKGQSLLWVHLVLLWWLSLTWWATLAWIGRGALRHRKAQIQRIWEQRQKERDDEVARGEGEAWRTADGRGWRARTLMVSNLPANLRDEGALRKYFEDLLNPDNDTLSVSDRGAGSSGRPQAVAPPIQAYHPIGADEKGGVHTGKDGVIDKLTTPPSPVNHSVASKSGQLTRSPSEGRRLPEAGQDGGDRDANSARPVPDLGPLSCEATSAVEATAKDRKFGDTIPGPAPAHVPQGPAPDPDVHRYDLSPVQTVVLVRKMGELRTLLARRQDVLGQLEAAHIKLAQNVMDAVEKRVAAKKRKGSRGVGEGMGRGWLGWMSRVKEEGESGVTTPRETEPAHEPGASGNGAAKRGEGEDVEKAAQAKADAAVAKANLDELVGLLGRFAPSGDSASRKGNDAVAGDVDHADVLPETVWEALAAAPRHLLDRYQPLTRLSALFRGQNVPTIDYLLAKLNLLTALVTDLRSRSPSDYEATSTAFVTFRDPRQARMVWRELKTQIVIKVRLAPEVKDLDWENLMRTSFTGDVVRGSFVHAFFWGFTIFWVIPIQALTTTLVSLQNLQAVIPPLRSYFQKHPSQESFFSLTLPTLLVALITMSVPEIVFQISKRFQSFVTFSKLYDQCLCRYWKFLICNVVIFFCIGVTTFESIINGLTSGKVDLLKIVAFAFPKGAPFFVSWLILGISMQSGFELFGFMVPLIQHLGARSAVTPRARAIKTQPRNFNRYYWLPFHLLVLSIVFIFAILNPLVVPFAFAYLCVALIVFKKQFAQYYYRRFNEKDGVVYYTRLLRYSLDSLVLSQVVMLAFFAVEKLPSVYIGMSAVLIPLTVFFKMAATRLWKSQCRALEDDEANAQCGIDPTLARHRDGQGEDAWNCRAPVDARANGRYPSVPQYSSSTKFGRDWQRMVDSFYANGNDRSTQLPMQTDRQGSSRFKSIRRGARVAAYPAAAATQAVTRRAAPFHLAAKQQLGNLMERDKPDKDPREHSKTRGSDERPFLDGVDAALGHAATGAEPTASDYPSKTGEKPVPRATSLVTSRSLKIRPTSPRLSALAAGGNTRSDASSEDVQACRPLVCTHPKLRWDDTPDADARYDNPFYRDTLDPYLWLPRDPLKPLNLCDTIEWHGPAFVSSEGGGGVMGEWEEEGETQTDEGEDVVPIDGRQHVSVRYGPLALRLEEMDEEEKERHRFHWSHHRHRDVSIPRNVMADWRSIVHRSPSSRASQEVNQFGAVDDQQHRRFASGPTSTKSDYFQPHVPSALQAPRKEKAPSSAPPAGANELMLTDSPKSSRLEAPPTVQTPSAEAADKPGANYSVFSRHMPSPPSGIHSPIATPSSHPGRGGASTDHAAHSVSPSEHRHRRGSANISVGSHAGTCSLHDALRAEVLEEERQLSKKEWDVKKKDDVDGHHADEPRPSLKDRRGSSYSASLERQLGRRPGAHRGDSGGSGVGTVGTRERPSSILTRARVGSASGSTNAGAGAGSPGSPGQDLHELRPSRPMAGKEMEEVEVTERRADAGANLEDTSMRAQSVRPSRERETRTRLSSIFPRIKGGTASSSSAPRAP